MMKLSISIAVAAASFAFPAGASQNPATIDAARQAGVIGERYDGYMGFVGTPSAEVRRQVSAVNLRRRNLYIGLASRRAVNPQVVGIATACELIPNLAPGQFYMLEDGVWRRRIARQAVALPGYCKS
ncbi:MAG: YdbL family protein [Sphingomonas sp.]|jgi:uncharacterized protein YdbL (DUF1318 family)|nr:YdbL family protein [Sphingomonas sp.]